MQYQNTLIRPDGTISVEYHDTKMYFHSEFFNVMDLMSPRKDEKLSDTTWVHTAEGEQGTYVLIAQSSIAL